VLEPVPDREARDEDDLRGAGRVAERVERGLDLRRQRAHRPRRDERHRLGAVKGGTQLGARGRVVHDPRLATGGARQARQLQAGADTAAGNDERGQWGRQGHWQRP
jgi:hypothetical protein